MTDRNAIPRRDHARLAEYENREAKRYVLTKRVPIPPGTLMGRSLHLRDKRARWHILNESGAALCGRQSAIGYVDALAYVTAVGGRVCQPCHGQFSWTADPTDYVVENRGYITPCHIWTRALTKAGYAVRVARGSNGKKLIHAHREAYEATYGPIPDGYDLHHLCSTPPCIRADHLEPMTRGDHLRLHRGVA